MLHIASCELSLVFILAIQQFEFQIL